MVRYNSIIHVINDYCKTHFTNEQKKELLTRLTTDEKKFLLACATGFEAFKDREKEYDYRLENATSEELFEYERQIFDNLGQRQRKRLLENCEKFNPKEYLDDKNKLHYPTLYQCESERKQVELQDNMGYPEGVQGAIKGYWTGGQFDKIQKAFIDGDMEKIHEIGDAMGIEAPAFYLKDYIENDSPSLQENTVLWRGGHWDVGTKVGDVLTTPAFNSTSFNEDTAYNIGIKYQGHKENPYMIKIYAPEGTKGMCVNTEKLASPNIYPEHEFLLGPNQKYIVLDVDDVNHTASIKLVN